MHWEIQPLLRRHLKHSKKKHWSTVSHANKFMLDQLLACWNASGGSHWRCWIPAPDGSHASNGAIIAAPKAPFLCIWSTPIAPIISHLRFWSVHGKLCSSRYLTIQPTPDWEHSYHKFLVKSRNNRKLFKRSEMTVRHCQYLKLKNAKLTIQRRVLAFLLSFETYLPFIKIRCWRFLKRKPLSSHTPEGFSWAIAQALETQRWEKHGNTYYSVEVLVLIWLVHTYKYKCNT